MERAWRYHPKHEAKIFEGEDAIKEAEEAGWVDSPAKVIKESDVGSDGGNGTVTTEPVVDTGSNDGGSGGVAPIDGSTPEPVVDIGPTEEETKLGFKIPDNLKDLSVKKLKKVCKIRELTGYSNLNEAGLIALLEG